MRIVSLIPSATEIVYALGAEASLVGVTHECDFPAEARAKPILTLSRASARATISGHRSPRAREPARRIEPLSSRCRSCSSNSRRTSS